MSTKRSENPREKLQAKLLHRRWIKVVTAMASVVVFCVVYALILPAITMTSDAVCGMTEHAHAAECYDEEGNLICGLEEHEHTLECYSDLNADVESYEEWTASVPALSGDRNSDVVAVAVSQLGYTESDNNYLVTGDDQTQGYTRFGHWYGDAVDGGADRLENGLSTCAYADWNAMFTSFVLDQAGIYDMGYSSDAGDWAGALSDAGIYADAADYTPVAGDLVFFDSTGAGTEVGIVSGVNADDEGNVNSVYVITGDSDNSVSEIEVANAGSIYGYGILTPVDEEPVEEAGGEIEELSAEELQSEEIPAEELQSEELPAEELQPEELPAEEAAPVEDTDEETVDGDSAEAEEIPAVTAEESDGEQAGQEETVPEENIYSYSLTEGTSIKLSDLIAACGMPVSLSEIESVTSADETLLSVRKPENGENYVLSNLAPYEDALPVTIQLQDGSIFIINVKLTADWSEAQTISTSTGEYNIEVSLPAGMPKGEYTVSAARAEASEEDIAQMDSLVSTTEDVADGVTKVSHVNPESVVLLDITLYKDGEVYEPDGEVKVAVTEKKGFLAGLFGGKEEVKEDLPVVHFPENGEAELLESSAGEFVTDGFSIFAVSYTVDFTYEGYIYSLGGNHEITLTELMDILGIDADPAQVEDVICELAQMNDETVDEAEFYASKEDDEWIFRSDVAFGNIYSLTLKMKDGTSYIIEVSDATVESTDLTNFLKNVVISGAEQNPDGSYTVEKGKEYSFIMTCSENSAYQFQNDGTLTYTMPAGVKVLSPQQDDIKVNIVYKGKTYQVDGTYSLDVNGNLQITFDQNDPDYPKLVESTNVSFRFTCKGSFDGSQSEIHFSDTIEKDIVFEEDKPGEVYAEKSAVYDENTGKFTYTIKVTASGGDVTNVNVKDVISGDALIFNNDVVVSGNSSSYTDNGSPNGFDYTFASMKDGEEITITYSAQVDFSKDANKDGKISADQTKNTVTVEPEDGPPHNSEYSHEITFKSTNKSNGTTVGVTEDGDKIIEWTIEYNPLALAAAGGDTIKDTISAGSTDYMKYYGSGITVQVRDKSGRLVRTDNIAYTVLTAHSDSSWTYTIPTSDTTPYSYVITYQTVVDQKKVDGGGVPITVSNDANGDNGSAEVGPTNQIGITKEVESQSTSEVTWVSTITVPEAGLTQAVVTDTVPSVWLTSGQKYDYFKDGSLEITGLINGENYVVDTSDPSKVVITFYKNQAHQPGLQGTEGGHTITIKLTTTVDQEWLQAGYDTPGYLEGHTNNISFNGKTAQATAIFGKPGIEKTGKKYPEGGDIQGLEYSIRLSGVSEVPVSITDTFDRNILEVDTNKSIYIYGGNQYYQGSGQTPVMYSDTSTGILLTADPVPMDSSGNYYPYYRITYYLKLKEGVDLEKLAQQNGGKYVLENTAVWNGHESTYSYETVYNYLDKELVNETNLGGTERKAQYKITFNPAKASIVDPETGEAPETVTMKDVLSSNLSIDYGSISIVTDPEGISVPYTISGNQGETIVTYTVPNETKVTVTYEAMVTGNGSQRFINTVSVLDDSATVDKTKDFGAQGEGEGAVASFKVVKVDGYDANKKLEGVQFKVFCEDPDLAFDKQGTKEIILTTDENGEIVLDGAQYDFYFGEVYHIQEVEAPDDYAPLGFDYLVTLTNDMAEVDYEHYVYYFSDSMQIKNWPLEGLVVEKLVESSDDADLDKSFKFRVSILDENGNVDTSYNEKNGDDDFVNGSFEFELKSGEQKMFWGFEKGTKYLVEEVLTDEQGREFTTTVSYNIYNEEGEEIETKEDEGTSHTGELTQNDELLLFKNKKESKGGLKLTKEVTVNGEAATGSVADGTYTFTVSRPAGAETPIQKSVEITVTNGRAASATVEGEEVTLTDDGYVVINDLEAGVYTITETAPTNGTAISKINDVAATQYSTTVTVTAGDEIAEAATAKFTNNIDVGNLQISKAVTEGSDTTAEFTFTVTLIPPDGMTLAESYPATLNGEDTTAVVSDGAVSITLKADDVFFIKNLPAGTTYTVTEAAKDGWEKTGEEYSNSNKTITKDTTDTAAFTNRQNGALKLTKEVTVNGETTTGTLADGEYTFTVTGPGSDAAVNKTVVIKIVNGEVDSATVDGTAAELTDAYVVISNLKPGTYTITETEPANGTSISKINGTETTVYSTTVTVKDGDTAAADAVATFTNNIDTGNLELKKIVSGTTDPDKTFSFTIELTALEGVTLEDTYPATLDGVDTTVTIENGKITAELKADQVLVVKDLPAGTSYKITEDDYSSEGFVQGAAANLEGTIPAKETIKASVENKFQAEGVTDFKVKKTFTNGDLGKKTFTFTLTQVDGDKSTTPVTTKLPATVTVSTSSETGGTTQTISFDLPDDFKFTQDDVGKTFWFLIEESVEGVNLDDNSIDQANNIQYDKTRQKWVKVSVTKSGSKLDIKKSTPADAAADAEFKNEQLGEIKVEKIATKGGTKDTSNTETFYFGLSSASDPFTRVAETENVSVTANEAAKTAWTNLPLGTYYVFEMNGNTDEAADTQYGEYTVTGSGTEVTLNASAISALASITNDKELVDIDATKTWRNSSGQDITATIANAEITFKLQQKIGDGGWTDVTGLTAADNTNEATVTLKTEGTASADKSAWKVSWTNLPKYNKDGETIKYQVAETIVKPADAVSEGAAEAVVEFEESAEGNDKGTAGLINTLPPTELGGTKTWITTSEDHGNPTLILTRKSAKEGSADETVSQQPTWSADGKTYSYTDLPKYDDEGYEYTYTVAEAPIDNYISEASDNEQNGKDFINTELTEASGSKEWLAADGSRMSDSDLEGAKIKLKLTRYKGEVEDTEFEPIEVELDGTADAEPVEIEGTDGIFGQETPAWTYEWTKLVKSYAADGSESCTDYVYKVEETAITYGGKEYTVTKGEDGSYTVTVDGAETGLWVVTQNENVITNRVSQTEFEFTKLWVKTDETTTIEWPKDNDGNDIPIKVTLGRKAGEDGAEETLYTYTVTSTSISSDDAEAAPAELTTRSDVTETPAYSYKITGLDKAKNGTEYIYFMTEEELDGFRIVYNSGTGSDRISSSDDRIIKNVQEAITLPHTGGFGTAPVRTAGIIMILMAAFGAFLMRRRERRCGGR